jgi:hypothetical protein
LASRYDEISHVMHITSGAGASCEHCDALFESTRFSQAVNHYIADHGYRVLHVGSESAAAGAAGEPIINTVAVLGKQGQSERSGQP